MNEEQKPIMTQAELEARVQQFRQELRDAAAAEEATKQTVGEVTPTPGPACSEGRDCEKGRTCGPAGNKGEKQTGN